MGFEKQEEKKNDTGIRPSGQEDKNSDVKSSENRSAPSQKDAGNLYKTDADKKKEEQSSTMKS